MAIEFSLHVIEKVACHHFHFQILRNGRYRRPLRLTGFW